MNNKSFNPTTEFIIFIVILLAFFIPKIIRDQPVLTEYQFFNIQTTGIGP